MRLDLTKPFALLLDAANNVTQAPENREDPIAHRAMLRDIMLPTLFFLVTAATVFLFRKKIATATEKCTGFFGSNTTHSSEAPDEQRRLLNGDEVERSRNDSTAVTVGNQ